MSSLLTIHWNWSDNALEFIKACKKGQLKHLRYAFLILFFNVRFIFLRVEDFEDMEVLKAAVTWLTQEETTIESLRY